MKGAVVLTVVKPVRVTHLVVRLHGHVRVFNTANAPGDGISPDSGSFGTGRLRKGNEQRRTGYASLFEDEITLCGEGRLDVGRYEFNFELDFPSKGVPSSIDVYFNVPFQSVMIAKHFKQFERGTISYSITSTITRPTAIAPTSSCDRKIYLVETVDVAPLSQPKQRMITLNPISREKKIKSKDLKRLSIRPPSTRTSSGPTANAESVPQGDAQHPERPVHSPAPSEASTPSVISSSTRSSRAAPRSLSAKDSDSQSITTSLPDKTITATIELVRAGCLPGDILPVKIFIGHTKPIKSLEGIIVTLYRQGRIDTRPTISVDLAGKGKGVVRSNHDYYPRSKAGLAALSLSTAGTNGVFRKDLSQTFAPLIVDPRSLTAVVKTSVRVPEDSFPTISTVPGSMISFKYYVEVIVDLRGKLQAGLDNLLPRLSRSSILDDSQNNSHILQRDENGAREVVSTSSGSILDTEHIRRERSVAACLFEVIVGTRDSGRKRTTPGPSAQQPESYESSIPPESTDVRLPDDPEDRPTCGPQDGLQSFLPSGTRQLGENLPPHLVLHSPTEGLPPPVLENEDTMDEKTRIRRAEERLLPSQPPAEGTSVRTEQIPTAPGLLDPFEMYYTISQGENSESSTYAHAYDGPSPSSAQTIRPSSDTHIVEGSGSYPGEDKLELERRRLQLEASAPEDFPDDDGSATRRTISGVPEFTHLEPSAPVLQEDEDYHQQSPSYLHHDPGLGTHSATGESLPRYER